LTFSHPATHLLATNQNSLKAFSLTKIDMRGMNPDTLISMKSKNTLEVGSANTLSAGMPSSTITISSINGSKAIALQCFPTILLKVETQFNQPCHDKGVCKIIFSQSQKNFLTAGQDKRILIWDS
jgi:WD40 repeat protein